jgi:hypothetical protein
MPLKYHSKLDLHCLSCSDFSPAECTKASGRFERMTISKNSWIVNCLFENVIGLDAGGALSSTVEGAWILIESAVFRSCSVSDSASNTRSGAIYVSNSSSCALLRVCGINCTSSSLGQVAYTRTLSAGDPCEANLTVATQSSPHST